MQSFIVLLCLVSDDFTGQVESIDTGQVESIAASELPKKICKFSINLLYPQVLCMKLKA